MNQSDDSPTAAPSFLEWMRLCAQTDEFVQNYNRLSGARINFAIPHRTPFEALIDAATGHGPMPKNDPAEMSAFVGFCADMYARMPEAEPA